MPYRALAYARIARNVLIDRSRRQHPENTLFDASVDTELAPGGLDPERITAAEQTLMRVLVAIEALPPRCREAFELHRLDGLSYVRVANRMGISTSMVEKHIAEAKLRLTRSLACTQERGDAIRHRL